MNPDDIIELREEYEAIHWKGYFIGNMKCHCGAETYITGRGTPKGWTGIECCSCGNLIEICACKNGLPSKEIVKNIVDKTENRIIYPRY